MSNNTDWELRAKVGGELVDLQGKALKAALVETDAAAREAYMRMSKMAEDAFLNVVPEARAALALGVELERLVPDALLALADELDQQAQSEGQRGNGGRSAGFADAAQMARTRAAGS